MKAAKYDIGGHLYSALEVRYWCLITSVYKVNMSAYCLLHCI